MRDKCKVTVNGKTYEYLRGTAFEQIARDMQKDYPHTIVLVTENGKLRELNKTVENDCTLEMVTTASSSGHKTYKRSVSLLMFKAFKDVLPEYSDVRVMVQFSISNAFYCQLRGNIQPDARLLEQVEARMRELVEAEMPIIKRTVSIEQARRMFRAAGMDDKDELFRFRRGSRVNIYSLGDYRDYFYGYMVANTRYLTHFKLALYDEGFILMMPEKEHPEEIGPFRPSEKVFEVQKQSERWGEAVGVDTVGRLNACITDQKISHIMLVEEALQESRISDIAETILDRKNLKFIMIAGPSSSGKTTFSRRLCIQLSAHALSPHPVSLDNYYKERKEIPRDENGEMDFECLESLDLELFESQMTALLNGEEIEMPRYNFTTGIKEYKGDRLKLGENDILVLEGIHGLNNKLSAFIPAEKKFKIYLSALTQLNIDEHNRIPTTDGRLLRRIIRDYRTRATSAKETIAMWDSVRRGEEKYIFPNQEEADVMFNSALVYEMAVLKTYAEPLLFQIRENEKEFLEAKRLLKFLEYFLAIPSEEIPNNSILREFVGGSCFDV